MIKRNYPGRFIVFEGLDGSGSTTQADFLVQYLNRQGQKAILTKEPTNNIIGGLIRGQLSHDWKTKQECLQLLFAADRAHHLEKEILPALEKGIHVISDRYFFSRIAFGSLDIGDLDWLIKINDKFILPDITFILKVRPEVCLERIKASRFGVELFEDIEKLGRVWQIYEEMADQFENVHILDGEEEVENISARVIDIVQR